MLNDVIGQKIDCYLSRKCVSSWILPLTKKLKMDVLYSDSVKRYQTFDKCVCPFSS